MNILFDHERLLQLITNLHTLTGIRANIFDVNGKDICLSEDHAPFCELINGCPEGHARCEACDARAVREGGEAKLRHYRCHAGVYEAILPIREGGVPVAYLVFGQLLDKSPLEEQWRETEKTLDWYPGDRERLKEAFWKFRQYSGEEIAAYSDILEALASYIQLQGMIRTSELTQLQKLEIYLDEHYTEKLSLETVAAHLNVGRTKLCVLAKKLSGGKSLSWLIAQRRVETAKKLLIQSDRPISVVAEMVGISDYNYFTKVFRSVTGMTPSTYRKRWRDHRSGVKER